MYFIVEQSRADFASQFSEEYADKVMASMPSWSFILVAASIFVFALVGGRLETPDGKTMNWKDHHPMSLSGGQKQRVAIACCTGMIRIEDGEICSVGSLNG